MTARSREVTVDGVRLRVVDEDGEGLGRPILALHGFTGDAESMEVVSEGFRERHRVLRLELIGHGGSDAPRSVAQYAMSRCANQICGVVAALELDRPHLIGYSMGGRAALAAAVANPLRFSSLTLIGASPGIVDGKAREARVRADEALADRIESRGIEPFVDEWMELPIFASQVRLGEAALARARAQRLRQSERGLAHSLRGMGAGAQSPVTHDLPRLGLPVLLIVGDEDSKFQAIAREMESSLPNARVVILPSAGHAAHLEAPEAFVTEVSKFFAAQEAERDRAEAE